LRFRLIVLSGACLLAFLGVVSAQSIWTLEWDPNPPCSDPCLSTDAYRPSVDGVNQPDVTTPVFDITAWTSDGASHTYGVAAVHQPGPAEVVSPPATLTYPSPQDPVPTPTPPPAASPSPDGTTIPPAAEVIDTLGHQWTLGAQNFVLRDGALVNGWQSSKLLWLGGFVDVLGLDQNWWQWSGVTWVNVGPTEPGVSPSPEPTPTPTPTPEPAPAPPPPPSWTCVIPQAVKSYSNGDKQVTLRCPKTFPGVKGNSVTVTVQ
jgi:hypothetical protein